MRRHSCVLTVALPGCGLLPPNPPAGGAVAAGFAPLPAPVGNGTWVGAFRTPKPGSGVEYAKPPMGVGPRLKPPSGVGPLTSVASAAAVLVAWAAATLPGVSTSTGMPPRDVFSATPG